MTISTQNRTAGPFAGNNAATFFPFNFKVFAAKEVLVVRTDDQTSASTELTLTKDYTVTLNGDQNANPGGTVTLLAPLAAGFKLVLTSQVEYLQPMDLTNQGGFYPAVINAAFDRITILAQQLYALASRSLRFPLSDIGTNTELPQRASRINKLLGFDAEGNPTAIVPSEGSSASVVIALNGPEGVAMVGNAADKRLVPTLAALAASAGAGLIGFIQNIVGAVPLTVLAKLRQVKHVDDWGGDLKLALTNCAPYTTIVLGAKTYDITGLYSHDFNFGAGPFVGNTKAGIRLQGAGMPRLNATGTALEGGTVLQGTLFNLAHDFECYDLGVDCGLDVQNNKYAGGFAEVFVPGANTTYPAPQPTIKNMKCDRIIALGAAPIDGNAATYKHVMLFENLENVKIGSIEAVGGWHAFVSKSIDLQCANLTVRGGMGDSMNLNANAANYCRQNQFGNVLVDSWFQNNVEQKPGTIMFYSDQTVLPFLTKFKINSLVVRNFKPGTDVLTAGGDSFVTDVAIGHLDVDMGTSGAAVLRMGYGPTKIQRFSIGSHNIITGGRSFELGPNVVGMDIGHGLQTFIADATIPLMTFDAIQYTHGNILMSIAVAQTAPYMVQRNEGDLDISRIAFAGAAAPPARKLLSSGAGGFVLSANAAQLGNPVFASAGASYRPYRVQFTGVLKMTAAGSNISLGAVSPGPLVNMRFPCHVQLAAGGTPVIRTLEITVSGSVAILDAMAVNDLVFLDSISFDALTR